jgi:hypothetical protein
MDPTGVGGVFTGHAVNPEEQYSSSLLLVSSARVATALYAIKSVVSVIPPEAKVKVKYPPFTASDVAAVVTIHTS